MHPYVVTLSRTAHLIALAPDTIILASQYGIIALHESGNTYYLNDDEAWHWEKRDLRLFREDVTSRKEFPKPRPWFTSLRFVVAPERGRFNLAGRAGRVDEPVEALDESGHE